MWITSHSCYIAILLVCVCVCFTKRKAPAGEPVEVVPTLFLPAYEIRVTWIIRGGEGKGVRKADNGLRWDAPLLNASGNPKQKGQGPSPLKGWVVWERKCQKHSGESGNLPHCIIWFKIIVIITTLLSLLLFIRNLFTVFHVTGNELTRGKILPYKAQSRWQVG